jgi:hypothetical protein
MFRRRVADKIENDTEAEQMSLYYDPSKMNVLLDLDNTLINALELDEVALLPKKFSDKFVHHNFENEYEIFGRPHLQEFLDFLFYNFNVSVWTAAERSYALFIIDKFLLTNPERKLHMFFYRHHVGMGEKRYGQIKDLRLLYEYLKVPNFWPCNTIIVDDLQDVQEANPLSTLAVHSFDMLVEGEDGNMEPNIEAVFDETLLKVMNFLKVLKREFTWACAASRNAFKFPLATPKKFI